MSTTRSTTRSITGLKPLSRQAARPEAARPEAAEPEPPITASTPIPFGKLKGKPHSDLLLGNNSKYAEWIVGQGPEFRYNLTRQWIIDNSGESERYEIEYALSVLRKHVESSLVVDFIESCAGRLGLI